MSSAPVHALDKFVLRLPDGMREKIGVAARENKRTMNAEIVSRLEQSFTGTKAPLLVVNENTSAADILMELPGSIQAVLNEIADIKAMIVKPGKGR